MTIIAPSLLAADFFPSGRRDSPDGTRGRVLAAFGYHGRNFRTESFLWRSVVKSIRPVSKLFFDLHLMIQHPLDYIDVFADAGADAITFHLESQSDPEKNDRKN